jgi:hypothetical protein
MSVTLIHIIVQGKEADQKKRACFEFGQHIQDRFDSSKEYQYGTFELCRNV